MSRASAASPKSHVRRVSLPGVLGEVLPRRWAQFQYPGFSPFALELICFDLRLRVPHEVTAHFARQPASIQDAIDRALVRHFHLTVERDGILVQAVQGQWREPLRPAPQGDFTRFRGLIRYSDALRPCIEQRWPEAGYQSFSDYVTALLRYDLLLLGQHNYFNGADTDPVILAALDRETSREFHENRQPKRIYLDKLLQETAGRALTQEELSARKLQVAEDIIQHALREDRQEKKC